MAAIRLVIVFCAIVLVCKGSASNTHELVSVLRDDADGEQLIQLGHTFNNSLLKLVGHTFENLEETVVHELCHKNPCTLWSGWTNCTAKGRRNSFGYQTRMRKCWFNSTDPCAHEGAATIETASKVCEGHCRSDYTYTKHGFCLKYIKNYMNHSAAVKTCESDGGHMINVDTKERVIDFEKITETQAIWVDGTRPNVKVRFSYHHGGDAIANGVVNWAKGEPGRPDELCLITQLYDKLYWWDVSCNRVATIVCEIRYM